MSLWPWSSDDDNSEPHEGLVWASFERNRELWHFGPDDQKPVTYDGAEKGALYRFIDNTTPSRTTAYNHKISTDYEIVMYQGNKKVEWREPIEDPQTMFLVTWGTANDRHTPDRLRYGDEPIFVVTEPVWEALQEHYDVAHRRAAGTRPKGLFRQLRKQE